MHARLLACAILAAALLGLPGCGSAVSSGTSTALDGFDLEEMADRMATGIMADPEVLREIEQRGSLKVVVLPVENYLTGEVLPEGQRRAFTAQVRVLLARRHPAQFTWINNRDSYYDMRARELEGFDLGPAPEAISPEYALHATFRSLVHDDRKSRSAFYQASFALTDINNRTTLWTDAYNVKKAAVKGMLD
jgi:hypothetical protein